MDDTNRCTATYVTAQTAGYTDLVRCQKPAGHRKRQHVAQSDNGRTQERWHDGDQNEGRSWR
ncbi:hypothetical protein QWJ90_00025 [Microbacterium oryzae]|uniref:hypothetical protein n=1 Tax=Microbacterium oryzae TaxID=743009 RepID=UPI0025B019C1|nr:hypothetical protein [Microbacterium oryzae]MDN3309314.1 hypothetical protein [Microbacterium oryzae]